MTAHDLAKRLLELPDFEVQLMWSKPAGNTVYALLSQGPAVSASGLVWLGVERLYGPDISREERLRLVPMLCDLCRTGEEELVKGATKHYAHRKNVGSWLSDCKARVLHELLETPVAVELVDDD